MPFSTGSLEHTSHNFPLHWPFSEKKSDPKVQAFFADIQFSLGHNYTTDMTTSAPCAGKLPGQPQIPQVTLETTISWYISPGKFLENQIITKSVPQSNGRERLHMTVTYPPTDHVPEGQGCSDFRPHHSSSRFQTLLNAKGSSYSSV